MSPLPNVLELDCDFWQTIWISIAAICKLTWLTVCYRMAVLKKGIALQPELIIHSLIQLLLTCIN